MKARIVSLATSIALVACSFTTIAAPATDDTLPEKLSINKILEKMPPIFCTAVLAENTFPVPLQKMTESQCEQRVAPMLKKCLHSHAVNYDSSKQPVLRQTILKEVGVCTTQQFVKQYAVKNPA